MPTTLYLDPKAWDLRLDAAGNIAVAGEPYSLAQNAATAIRTFLGECWYDQQQGVPYFEQILGHQPSLELMKAKFVAAALTVPGVVSAKVVITSTANREVKGQVQVMDSAGTVSVAAF